MVVIYFRFNVYILFLLLDCQCYAGGTMEYTNPSGVKQCNNETGICTCKEGYAGDKCETCDTGYFDQNINDTNLDVSCICNFCRITIIETCKNISQTKKKITISTRLC